MNDMSVKIEQLLKLQKGVCEQYEKENKELLKTIKAQEEQIRLLKQLIENQDKIIKALEIHSPIKYWFSFILYLCAEVKYNIGIKHSRIQKISSATFAIII